VKMGAPYFKVKELCEKNGVAVFSANFSLYTNMSDRVMLTLAEFTPVLEIYSVDEAFLDLSGFENFKNSGPASGLEAYGREIKRVVEKNTGIPVSIGIAPTKTLAKIANHIAKRSEKAGGVVDITSKKLQDRALAMVEVEDIWGVGRASAPKLRALGIKTAKDFRDYKNNQQIKKIFTKVGLQRKEELNGLARFELETATPKKKEIICSRTFGKSVFDLDSLRESVASYVSNACEKLRKQDSVCSVIEVYMRTSPFKNVPQYYASDFYEMSSATSDTRKVIKYAFAVLDKLYRDGYEYKKAGVRLSKILPKTEAQMGLFEKPDSLRDETLMANMDAINSRDGNNTLKVAACGVDNRAWKMNREYKSPRYVTGWQQLPRVK